MNTVQRRMAATPNTKDGSSVRTTAKTAAVQPVKTRHSSTRLEVKSSLLKIVLSLPSNTFLSVFSKDIASTTCLSHTRN